MRLIDADAFENYVFDEWQKNDVSNGDWITFREWLKDQETVVEFEGEINKVVVRGVEYVKPEQKWIPCSERLPEESQDVLVCTKYQGITDGMQRLNKSCRVDVEALRIAIRELRREHEA